MSRTNNTVFTEWAKQNAVPIVFLEPLEADDIDLKAIADSVGAAQIVALSEGCHNSRQMMSLHHCNTKYLIENCGFSIVVTENGLPESRQSGEYVQNKDFPDAETQYQDEIWRTFSPAGQMIGHSFGIDNVFIIGLIYGSGKYWKDWQKPETRTIAEIPAAKEDGIEALCLL
jgi:hypothetical protein